MRAVVAKVRAWRWGLVLALFIVSTGAGRVLAAEPFNSRVGQDTGITISPTQKEIVISSGLIAATTNVTLTNHTGQSLTGTIRLLDFKTLNETGGLLFAQAGVSTEKYGLAKWMTLPNGDVVNVPDGKSTTIPVQIANDQGMGPGGHYGAVVITFGDNGASGSHASFKQEVVSLLLVKKRGGERYGLQLQSLTTNRTTGLPEAASLQLRNTGNVQVIPRGYVTLEDSRGKLVAKGIINPDSFWVFPETSRKLVTTLQPISDSNFPGRYKLTAHYRYDEQATFSTKSVYVYHFGPLLKVLVLVAITGVTVYVLVRYVRKHRRRTYRM